MFDYSEQKKRRIKMSGFFGLVVGAFLFLFFYMVNPTLMYLGFIPIAGAMGAAVELFRLEPENE